MAWSAKKSWSGVGVCAVVAVSGIISGCNRNTGTANQPAGDHYGGQKLCPVSDEKLGSMGPPVKMTVKGETIYLCCESCRETVNENPDLYLSKIHSKQKENRR